MGYEPGDYYDKVEFVDYSLDTTIPDFDCGKDSLNEFINTDEVREFHRKRLGKTRLVYFEGELAAYFTLAPNALSREEYTGEEVSRGEDLYEKLPEIPARLLGRMAVDEAYKDDYLGSFLIDHIIALTRGNTDIYFRIILLHSHEDVVEFYEKNGFVLSQIDENQDRNNKIMLMDLGPIDEET